MRPHDHCPAPCTVLRLSENLASSFPTFQGSLEVSPIVPADETFLPRESGQWLLFSHNPKFFAAMRYSLPCEVVMIMDFLDDGSAENAGHFRAHPITSSVGVLPSQGHTFEILSAEVGVQHRGQRMALRPSRLSAPAFSSRTTSPSLCPKPRGPEMHADPHAVHSSGERDRHSDSRCLHSAELLASHLRKRRDGLTFPRRAIEQLVVYALLVNPPDTEADSPPNLIHDCLDVAGAEAGNFQASSSSRTSFVATKQCHSRRRWARWSPCTRRLRRWGPHTLCDGPP